MSRSNKPISHSQYAEYFSLATMETEQLTTGQQMPPAHNNGCVTCLTSATPGVSLSGSDDNSVTLYDYYNGKRLKMWLNHQQAVTRVVYGVKLRLAISASRDRKIAVRREEATAEEKWTVDAHNLPITGLDLSPDNTTICSGSRDNSLKLWDSETGQLMNSCSLARNLVTHLKWAKTSKLVVQTSEDKAVRLWDMRIPLCVLHSFDQKQYVQTHCDISEDENFILTCGNGNNGIGCETTLWDLRKRRPLTEYLGHQQTVNACIFLSKVQTLPSSTSVAHIATISSDQTVRLWDQTTADCVFTEMLDGAGPLLDIHQFQDDSLGISTYRKGIQRFMRGRRHTGEWILRLISAF